MLYDESSIYTCQLLSGNWFINDLIGRDSYYVCVF